jgi:hypothetical protein
MTFMVEGKKEERPDGRSSTLLLFYFNPVVPFIFGVIKRLVSPVDNIVQTGVALFDDRDADTYGDRNSGGHTAKRFPGPQRPLQFHFKPSKAIAAIMHLPDS